VPRPASGGLSRGGGLHFDLRQSFEIPGRLKFTKASKKSGLGWTEEAEEESKESDLCSLRYALCPMRKIIEQFLY